MASLRKEWRPKPCLCGSGKLWSPQYDARGIFLTYTCENCHDRKMGTYRPDVLADLRTGPMNRLKKIEHKHAQWV
jgi:hypothetical protein